MSDSIHHAPGWPGIPPRWTSSAKTGVGTALNQHSKVWFTLSHGILNEVYFPRVDQACTRDLGFNVTKDEVPVHDLHATILHLLGFDHKKLTYRFQGRDFRLTDVHGNVVQKLLA